MNNDSKGSPPKSQHYLASMFVNKEQRQAALFCQVPIIVLQTNMYQGT